MNIIKIYGGLGNQMFQYAFGRAMEINGKQVFFDLSWFNKPSDPPRPYGLDKFRTNIRKSENGSLLYTIKEVEGTYYRFFPEYLEMDNHRFFGYWQNRKYLENVLPILKEEFRIKSEFCTEEYDVLRVQILTEEFSIGIHVRRGDYLTKGHHLLPIEYYMSCLKYLYEEIHSGKVKLFVFSDDILWCKQAFGGGTVYIDMVDYLSLDLMRLCTYKITANSTFSLWAGILGEKEQSITFAPKRWRLKDEEENAVTEEKLVPDNWIRI